MSIEKGSRHEYIARTEHIEYPKNVEDYLEIEYPKNPDLFTDEFFSHLNECIETLVLIAKNEPCDPEAIVSNLLLEKTEKDIKQLKDI